MAPTEILARQHLEHHRAARRGGRHPRRDPHRPRARRASAADILDAARRRRDRSPDRHPRAVPGRCRVPRSRARGRRRAAPLRRAPAPGARPQGRGRRRAGDDRDADPAHAGADLFRRHGRFRAAREARRPQADRHPHRCRSTARRRWSTRSAARSREGRRVYWVCPLVEESENVDLAAAQERFVALQAALRRRGRPGARPHEGRRQGCAPWRASRPARPGSWSPPR